jgi:hypothetical protein
MGPSGEAACIGIICFSKKRASIKGGKRQLGQGKKFFIWIRSNPLKSPDSAKGIRGNPSDFIWISFGLAE